MANPLARVVMNNVVKKTNNNIGADKICSTNSAEKKNNLTHREEEILMELMGGEKVVREESHSVPIVSLDEAAEIARGRK